MDTHQTNYLHKLKLVFMFY